MFDGKGVGIALWRPRAQNGMKTQTLDGEDGCPSRRSARDTQTVFEGLQVECLRDGKESPHAPTRSGAGSTKVGGGDVPYSRK
jgi:hypothetical protein